jgi:hypothetical protein
MKPYHIVFFECAATKYVWRNVAMTVGATDRFGSFTQFFGGFLA